MAFLNQEFLNPILLIRIQIEGAEASEKAATVGKVYFNILRLECGEPKYPRVCVETEPKDNLKEKVTENSGLICYNSFLKN
jgi:hypothetical protein